jgi:hypothetical protein
VPRYPSPGTFHPLDPARILDTRDGTGVAGSMSVPLGAAQVIDVDVTGVGGVPETGVGRSHAQSDDHPSARRGLRHGVAVRFGSPYASNVNFVRGVDLANQVTVKVGTNGHICIFSSVTTQIIGDVNGWWGDGFESAPGFHYEAVDPARILDSRDRHRYARRRRSPDRGGRDSAGDRRRCRRRDPSTRHAVSFNLTATNVDGPGYVTVFPCGSPRPYASNINFASVSTLPISSRAASGRTVRCVSTARRTPI